MLSSRIGIGLVTLILTAILTGCGDSGTIEISALDELAFDPDQVTVSVGEPVTFVVANEGEQVHEFVLGPDHVQMAHEEASAMGEMHEGMHVEGQLAALDLEPGQTREVTVTFEEPGEMPFGCHEPGHFDGGMRGTVIVE